MSARIAPVPVWTNEVTRSLAHGYLVHCGGIHCERIMRPFSYACCAMCAKKREKGKATVNHTKDCSAQHELRTK